MKGLLGHPLGARGPVLASLQLGHRLRCSSNKLPLQVAAGVQGCSPPARRVGQKLGPDVRPHPSVPVPPALSQTPPSPGTDKSERQTHRAAGLGVANGGVREILRPRGGGRRALRRRPRPVAAEAAAGALLGGAGQGGRLALRKRSRGGRHGHQLGRRAGEKAEAQDAGATARLRLCHRR